MGRGLIIALIISLTLNVFAVGFISGRLLSHGKPPHMGPPGNAAGLESPIRLMRYAQTLPPDIRDEFRNKIGAQLPTLRREQREVARLRHEMRELIAADEWNREAISAAVAEIGVVQERQRVALYAAFIDAFEALPAEERKRFVQMEDRRRLERRERRKSRQQDDRQ